MTVIALLSVDSVLFCPASQRERAAATHHKFHSPHGDHMTLLAIYSAYSAAHNKKVSDECPLIVYGLSVSPSPALVQGELHSPAQHAHCAGCAVTASGAVSSSWSGPGLQWRQSVSQTGLAGRNAHTDSRACRRGKVSHSMLHHMTVSHAHMITGDIAHSARD